MSVQGRTERSAPVGALSAAVQGWSRVLQGGHGLAHTGGLQPTREAPGLCRVQRLLLVPCMILL